MQPSTLPPRHLSRLHAPKAAGAGRTQAPGRASRSLRNARDAAHSRLQRACAVAAATGVVRKRSEATKERLAWLRRTEARRSRGVVATRCRHALLASEAMAQEVLEAALREPHDFPKLCETLSLCRESAESSGDLGWVGKHDAFLEPLLPSSAREVALVSQPGDVLKLKTGRGWHVLRVEDVMLDLRVQRREQGEVVQRGFNDKTYAVETMGCQMNQADSERMEGQLQAAGLVPAAAKEDPDVIVLNTCSIRDKAEKRVYARLDPHLQRKRRGEDVTIVVSGCVAQQEGEALLSAIPEVDVVVGPQYANRLADVLNESLQGGQICATADARIMEDVTMPNRQSSISAWVNVIYGCNERCSYCVVPATRGSEQSRPMEAVKREVAQLTSEGYREVTLLGQNIDAWGRDLAPRRNFSELLHYVGDVAGLERLRFLTSHPRYISDELIHAVRDVDAVCEQFHIPFQSGDDDVLRRMERGYTAERYRQIVRKIRQEVPNAGLSADAIVGFPGETEEQFQRTVELVEEVGFLTVNLAAYSPRPNTLAATWPDQVPEDVKKDRLQRLGDVVLRTSLAQSQRLLGEVHELLVETPHPRRSGEVRGRLRNGRLCAVPGRAEELLGCLVPVRITEAYGFSVVGEIVGEPH